jgi:tetratricopeptide (TPR) repeat protein
MPPFVKAAGRAFLLYAASVPVCAAQQPAPAAAGQLAEAKAAMVRGLDAMQRGDLAEAHRSFARVVALAPRIEPGHAALGAVLLAEGDFTGAARQLAIAHQQAPDDLAAQLNLARAEAALGDAAAAVAGFRGALASASPPQLSPEETIAYAGALAATRQLPAAVELLRQANAQTAEVAGLHDALGTALAQSGDLRQAQPEFERAVALDPALALAQYHLAATLLALDRPEAAIEPAERAVEAHPDRFDFQLILGQSLSASHRDDEALAPLHRAARMRAANTAPDALIHLALSLQASGDAQGALPVFRAALNSEVPAPGFDRTSALTNLALAEVQTGDAKAAVLHYAQALKLGPDSATLREDFGAAYVQQANLDDAIVQFKAGLALDPDSAHLHYDLGLAYKLKDDLTAAVPQFEQAAKLDPTLPDPAFTLGVIYMQQGRTDEAIARLRQATILAPQNGDAWSLLGSLLKDSGDGPAAADALRHAIALEPEQPSLHIQLAALDAQAGRSADAAAERKIAADLSRAAMNQQRASFALKSGRSLLEQNKLPEALLQLTNAAQADPKLAEPHRLLAEIYTRQGKPADAALERKQAAALTQPSSSADPAKP